MSLALLLAADALVAALGACSSSDPSRSGASESDARPIFEIADDHRRAITNPVFVKKSRPHRGAGEARSRCARDGPRDRRGGRVVTFLLRGSAVIEVRQLARIARVLRAFELESRSDRRVRGRFAQAAGAWAMMQVR